jgi:hypothetical protein
MFVPPQRLDESDSDSEDSENYCDSIHNSDSDRKTIVLDKVAEDRNEDKNDYVGAFNKNKVKGGGYSGFSSYSMKVKDSPKKSQTSSQTNADSKRVEEPEEDSSSGFKTGYQMNMK